MTRTLPDPHAWLARPRGPAEFARAERDAQADFGLVRGGQSRTGVAGIDLFHADGLLREAALRALSPPLAHPVVAYGVAVRLNDWVPQVWAQARLAFGRCWPHTPAEVLAPAARAAIVNAPAWRRWGAEGRPILQRALRRADLVAELARLVAADGIRAAAVLAALAPDPQLDAHLPVLLASPHPHVRRRALEWISAGRVWWRVPGGPWIWRGPGLGAARTEEEMRARPLTVTPDLAGILPWALDDRAAQMRRAAADALTAHRADPGLAPLLARLPERLAGEHHPGVRARLGYLHGLLK